MLKVIGHICVHNQGLMTEALKDFVPNLFQGGRAAFVECSCLHENAACRKVLEKPGFEYVMTIDADIVLHYYIRTK